MAFSALSRLDTSAVASWVPKSSRSSGSISYLFPTSSDSSDHRTLLSWLHSLMCTIDPSRIRSCTAASISASAFGSPRRTPALINGAATFCARISAWYLASRRACCFATRLPTTAVPTARISNAAALPRRKRRIARRRNRSLAGGASEPPGVTISLGLTGEGPSCSAATGVRRPCAQILTRPGPAETRFQLDGAASKLVGTATWPAGVTAPSVLEWWSTLAVALNSERPVPPRPTVVTASTATRASPLTCADAAGRRTRSPARASSQMTTRAPTSSTTAAPSASPTCSAPPRSGPKGIPRVREYSQTRSGPGGQPDVPGHAGPGPEGHPEGPRVQPDQERPGRDRSGRQQHVATQAAHALYRHRQLRRRQDDEEGARGGPLVQVLGHHGCVH